MELNRVFEKKMVALFGLATIPEIRDHITSITDHCGNSWEDFSYALKDEYFLEDADRVTKELFLGWIERPNKNLQATELLREFERQYSQLSKVEKLTLEPNKVDLFLQAADGELQEKLEPLLEDKEEDEGLTTKWKNVEDAVGLLTKKERRKDRSNIPKQVQACKAPVRTTPPTMPTVQPSTSLSKKTDMGMEEIIRGMRDLQIKLARLEENTSINNSKNVSKQGYVQRCIWCDDASHTRKDCNEFNNMIRQGIICWKDGKIALKDREDLLQTNFGKGGMRALVQDYLKGHETVARESASYGARVDDEIGGSTETSEFWASAVSTMQEGKLPREALLRTTATIRGRTASQELPVKDTSASLGEKTTETKDKGKSIAYKLLSDIEAATNLKGVLEERILNTKVEFTLKEVLGITKKEFHGVIIDSIKRKRQLMSETGMSHTIDARICRDEEEVDIGYKQPINEKNGYNQRVRFEDSSDKEMETLSHYTRKHWARATTEVLVKVGDIEEPIVALVDHGSEINLKDLYKKQKWPIDMEHGWAIRAANNTRGELYGACPDVKIRIGDVATEQHFFVQDTTSYSLILGQPYITAIRMETKRDYGGTKEEVLSRDEGAFDASFIGILENGNIMYKKVEDFKRKERKRLYDIEGQLHKIENGLEDSLELITSIGLGDNDKIVEIHSREVYTMLESFQAPEVTVETRYKTADKKIKPVAGPLPEDSKEQMGEAKQFTEETFEELKIGSDGSLLPEEITCFEKMLAKQGRSFAFESHEIWCVDPNIITPMVIFTVPHLSRILGASTNSSTNTEWSGSVTPLQSARAYWNTPFDSNNGSQQEEKDQFTRRAVLFSVPSQGTLFLLNGFLKGKNGGESLRWEPISDPSLRWEPIPDLRRKIEEIQRIRLRRI
uniref:Predicted protein n=1 Tax=Physcomitrium patens TaxID=3218 RepID=A9U4X3_PHYPA